MNSNRIGFRFSKFLMVLCLTIVVELASGQPSVIYQQCYGGTGDDLFYHAIPARNGGIITTLRATSDDGDLIDNPESSGWVIKFNSVLEIEWQKFYYNGESPIKIIENEDGSLIFGGSCSGEHIESNGSTDIMVMKTDSLGEIIWSRCYGGLLADNLISIQATQDQGYLILGNSFAEGGDIPFHYGDACCEDAIIIKIDSVGEILWVKALGGSLNDSPIANSLENKRGFYQIHLFSSSNDYDLADCPITDIRKRWIIILDSLGNIINENHLSAEDDFLNFEDYIFQDAEFTMIPGSGNASSVIYPAPPGHSGEEGSVAIFDSTLNLVNMISFGGSNDDRFKTMVRDSSKNFYFLGYSMSPDYDLPNNYNGGEANDYWIMATDSNLNKLWSMNFGGSSIYGDYSTNLDNSNIIFMNNSLYVFTASITPETLPDFDISCGNLDTEPDFTVDRDAWLVAFSIPTNISDLSPILPHISILPNPAKDQCIISVEDGSTIDFIQIFDALQRPVFRQPFVQNTPISLAGLNEGIYFVGLYSSTGLICCEKLVIAQ